MQPMLHVVQTMVHRACVGPEAHHEACTAGTTIKLAGGPVSVCDQRLISSAQAADLYCHLASGIVCATTLHGDSSIKSRRCLLSVCSHWNCSSTSHKAQLHTLT